MRPHILLVDDDQIVLNALARLLRLTFEVDCVGCPREAVRQVRRRRYDAVVTDIKMPELDGLDLYHLIVTEHPELEGAFLFVSGSLETYFDPRWPSGVAMLLKPVSREELIPCVEHLVAGRDSTRPPRP